MAIEKVTLNGVNVDENGVVWEIEGNSRYAIYVSNRGTSDLLVCVYGIHTNHKDDNSQENFYPVPAGSVNVVFHDSGRILQKVKFKCNAGETTQVDASPMSGSYK